MRYSRILVVCLGNICRSPTGEAALRSAADRRDYKVEVDSAGTAAYHEGSSPDPRMVKAASEAGLTLGGVARQVNSADFDEFDLILAMDRTNLLDLRRLAPTPAAAAKVRIFREHDPLDPGADMPDPYYGEADGFRQVVVIAQRTADAVITALAEGRR